MQSETKKIVVLIPCRNEAVGIGDVIDGFPVRRLQRMGFHLQVIVIDNASTDATAKVAHTHGATVLTEKKPGKGNAMKRGFASVPMDADYVIMIDGDDSYRASELLRLIEPLDSGFCDVVIGSRLAGKIENDAMSLFNRLGNWGFSFMVRQFYRANVTDVLTGYWAWTRLALERMRPHVQAEGFGIEMDMVTKLARLKEEIFCVPISYIARSGDSNLRPVYDGMRILMVFLRNFLWRPNKVVVPETKRAGKPSGLAIPTDI